MTMKRIMYFAMVVIMMLASVSCSKHDDKDIDLPPTPPEEEEVPTINPIMTDFNDINQLYGTWTAKTRIVGDEEDSLQSPLSITFKKDGTFICVFDNTSISGTYTYNSGTAKCTYISGNTTLVDGYVLTFSAYDEKRMRVDTTQHMLVYKLTDCLLMSKTAEEQETQE